MDVKTLKKKTAALYSTEGYFERFFELKFENPYTSDTGIYIMLEKEHEEIFGQKKYSSEGSFRNAKFRYLKKLQRKRRN